MQLDKKSIVLLHGRFTESMIEKLKKRNISEVVILEGRPSLVSSQKTVTKLLKQNIKPTLISDNMAGFLFFRGLVKEVHLAYQTLSDEGALCQIGGLILAILAKKEKVPVRVWESEETTAVLADQKEIMYFKNDRVAPRGIKGYVPLVEWVANKYIKKVN